MRCSRCFPRRLSGGSHAPHKKPTTNPAPLCFHCQQSPLSRRARGQPASLDGWFPAHASHSPAAFPTRFKPNCRVAPRLRPRMDAETGKLQIQGWTGSRPGELDSARDQADRNTDVTASYKAVSHSGCSCRSCPWPAPGSWPQSKSSELNPRI